MEPLSGETLFERVIPLPHQGHVQGVERIPCDQIGVQMPADGPIMTTARQLLDAALPGATAGTGAAYTVRLDLVNEDAELAKLPNAAQAYAIRPTADPKGLELRALSPVGLLNAVRTLAQIVRRVSVGEGTLLLEMPTVTILDWPDLEERGQWGGNAEEDIAWTAPLKLNLLESGVQLALDDQGEMRAEAKQAVIRQAQEQGVQVVLYVPHIGELGWHTDLFRWHPEVAGTPNPDEPLPPDYKPILCFSKPETASLLAGMMTDMARTQGVNEICVWLTESPIRCYCESCQDRETYLLEVRGVVAGYRLAQQVNPALKLRLLLTQGSYPVNDLILRETPPDVKITYYDGGRTYDSSHNPMIYPLLEEYSRGGRWLGVYPQIDNCWRTVFPFTGPQFIRARLREFASKGLHSVTGYATPSNRFWEFNVGALAEWGWNSEGRDEQAFARAWARRIGIEDVDTYADWAVTIGPVAWDLAGSRFPYRLFYQPGRLFWQPDAPEAHRPLAFGQDMLAEIPSQQHLERNIAQARQALVLAQKLGDAACLAESEVILHSYLFLQALQPLSNLRGDQPLSAPEKADLATTLATLETAAERAVTHLWAWSCAVYSQTPIEPQHRFQETMSVLAQTVQAAHQMGEHLGITDPHPQFRDRLIGHWTAADFATPEATLTFDVTHLLREPGLYRPMFRFRPSAYGIDINAVSILEESEQGQREIARSEPTAYGSKPHPGPFEPWNDDAQLQVAEVHPACRYLLRAELRGIPEDAPADRRTCEGDIFLRRAWA